MSDDEDVDIDRESKQPGDTLRARADDSRTKLWFLLEADRRLVAGALLALVFVSLTLVGYLHPNAEAAIRTSDSIDTLFQAMLGATITGVTLVLTLNQLVLSQELGAVDDQRERMVGAMNFRDEAAELLRAPVSPARPAQFLRALVQVASECAADLRQKATELDHEELETEVGDFTDSLRGNAESVAEGLDGARFGDFDVVSSALDFNYSWKIFTARRIHERFGDAFDEAGRDTLERLIEVLKLFGPAREHVKTLYFQWELIELSRTILLVSIPALLVSTGMIVFFNDATYHVAVADMPTLVAVVSAAATVALWPFVILLAYVLRIATVTKHTLSIGPFILRETDQIDEVEWDR
jgi:hypothetical protein